MGVHRKTQRHHQKVYHWIYYFLVLVVVIADQIVHRNQDHQVHRNIY